MIVARGLTRYDTYATQTERPRGANDLVWVGRSANYAAKLSALDGSHSTYITAAIYNGMNDEVKLSNGTNMWTALRWNEFDNSTIYGSSWRWAL